jgi:hypothetical protein
MFYKFCYVSVWTDQDLSCSKTKNPDYDLHQTERMKNFEFSVKSIAEIQLRKMLSNALHLQNKIKKYCNL